MDHYWHKLPPEADGLQWFSGVDIYTEQVRRAKDGAIFVELGCWKGRSTSFMGVEIHNSGKQIAFYAVDHWLGSDEEAHRKDDDVRAERLLDVFLRNIEPVRQHIHVVRRDSADAATQFEDGSVDFVYVDAGHTRDAVRRDLDAWWPKLKSAGVLAGDDWQFKGVEQAVAEFAMKRRVGFEVLPGNPNNWKQWRIVKP